MIAKQAAVTRPRQRVHRHESKLIELEAGYLEPHLPSVEILIITGDPARHIHPSPSSHPGSGSYIYF